jgi:hypothetical protein
MEEVQKPFYFRNWENKNWQMTNKLASEAMFTSDTLLPTTTLFYLSSQEGLPPNAILHLFQILLLRLLDPVAN